MSHQITLLVATMTGTAELVAAEVASALAETGHQADIVPCDSADNDTLARGGVFLIVSSTYGNGDVPDNARQFVENIDAARPDLTNIAYGLIALGDSTYRATYCHGAKKFDQLFTDCGARRVGEPLYHDASAGTIPEDEARSWVNNWARDELSRLQQAA